MSPILVLAACALENGLDAKDADPAVDTADETAPPDTAAPPAEECNGVDDDGDGAIDEGFPDDDGNGRVDCLDATCPPLVVGAAGPVAVDDTCLGEVPPVADPWTVRVAWRYTAAVGGVAVMPAVGDLDADGVSEVVVPSFGGGALVVLDGATGAVRLELGGYDGEAGVALADVDADGAMEVVAVRADHRVVALDAAGRVEWRSEPLDLQRHPQPTVADLDGDGAPEVVVDVAVLDGASGVVEATLAVGSDAWRTPVVADLDQDGAQEIVLGPGVFDAAGAARWTSPADGFGAFAAVVDVDGDAEGEVILVVDDLAWVHDADGALLGTFPVGTDRISGPPCAADFDGDGAVELAVPNGRQLGVFGLDGSPRWAAPVSDRSGMAGCAGFDLDADGAWEVLYADEGALRVLDGATGATRFEDGDHTSATLWEYPVVADLDGDGAAELVVAENGWWNGVTVYRHAGDGWPPAGPAWPVHDFAATNLGPHGEVPARPEPAWSTLGVFRARPLVDDPSLPDLRVAITDACVADCAFGPVRVAVQVANHGGADVPAGATLALYAADDLPRLVATLALPAIPAGAALEGVEFALAPGDVGVAGLLARVDDDGSGAGGVKECDEANNEARFDAVGCP